MALYQTNGVFFWRYQLPDRVVRRTGRTILSVSLTARHPDSLDRLTRILDLSAQHLIASIQAHVLEPEEDALVIERFHDWCRVLVHGWIDKDTWGRPALPKEQSERTIAGSVVDAIKAQVNDPGEQAETLANFLEAALDRIGDAAQRPVVVQAPTANLRLQEAGPTPPSGEEPRATARLSELLDEFGDDLAVRTTPDYAEKCQDKIRLFIELIGDMPVADVRPRHVQQFMDLVADLPANWWRFHKRRHPDMPVREIIPTAVVTDRHGPSLGGRST